MLNFFRKIRRGSLRENQIGKYLKYALGEILLVVLGILIALQVNNWNEDRNYKQSQAEYLKQFSTDVDSMALDYSRSLDYFKASSKSSLDAFNALKNCEVLPEQKKVLDQMLLNYNNLGLLYQIRDTYEEMLSANVLTNLDDIELKSSITNFFAQRDAMMIYINDFQEDLNLHSSVIEKQVVFSFDSNNQPQVDYNLSELCQNEALSNALYKHVSYKMNVLDMRTILTKNLERLKTILKKHNLESSAD